MKKIILALTLSAFSFGLFAQENINDDERLTDSTATINVHDKIAALEKDMKTLKESHAELSKKITELKQQQMPVKKKKLVVSRTSSKQGIWVDE